MKLKVNVIYFAQSWRWKRIDFPNLKFAFAKVVIYGNCIIIVVIQFINFAVLLTCNIPYLYSMSKKWYSRACAGLAAAGCCCCEPAPPGGTAWLAGISWWAKMLARLAKTGSEAKARVSEHSSVGCSTCRIFGWRNLSNWRTEPRRISVTVSLRFGLCSFSALRFSNRKMEHSWNKIYLLAV